MSREGGAEEKLLCVFLFREFFFGERSFFVLFPVRCGGLRLSFFISLFLSTDEEETAERTKEEEGARERENTEPLSFPSPASKKNSL